jgi:phosphatidylserine decarboxylase
MDPAAIAPPLGVAAASAAALYWRYVWFFRNPVRTPPREDGVLSPADGTVVYVKHIASNEAVICIKKGMHITVSDIARSEMPLPKLLVGVFMSPFNVHYNRAPVSGRVALIRHHPAQGHNVHMGSMHLRVILGRLPLYTNSRHLLQNERTVTRIDGMYRGRPMPCHVVQIAAKTVRGIDSYVQEGQVVERGQTFGMIRIGSQVDLVLPWTEDLEVAIRPGDKVRAGETILVR